VGYTRYYVYLLSNKRKGWIRVKKNALVTAHNRDWRDLAADRYGEKNSGSFAGFAAQDDTGS
jgi:hypothetical protein